MHMHSEPERVFSPGHETCHHFTYLLSCAEYEAMLAACGNRCEICRLPGEEVPHRRKLHIDHEHRYSSHAVRGLLCHKCNARMRRWDEGAIDPSCRVYAENAWFLRVVRNRPRDTRPWRTQLYPPRPALQNTETAND